MMTGPSLRAAGRHSPRRQRCAVGGRPAQMRTCGRDRPCAIFICRPAGYPTNGRYLHRCSVLDIAIKGNFPNRRKDAMSACIGQYRTHRFLPNRERLWKLVKIATRREDRVAVAERLWAGRGDWRFEVARRVGHERVSPCALRRLYCGTKGVEGVVE